MINQPITCDILVIGGGAAGVSAAVGAARRGAHVLLVEKYGFLGGKATAAYVNTICGLYYISKDIKSRYVAEGFMQDFAERLRHKSKTIPVVNKYHLHFLPFNPHDFKFLCDEYFLKESIEVYFHSFLTKVVTKDNKIESVDVWAYDRLQTIHPKVVIDTTGEATVSVMANLPILESEIYQASAIVFAMDGVQVKSEENLGFILMKEIQQAIQQNTLSEAYARCSLIPGSIKGNQVYFKIGIPIELNNDLNKISMLEKEARKLLNGLASFLINTIEEFKNARIVDVAPEVGVRTGLRHEGQYVLTKEDVLSSKKQDFSIGRGAWPIEYWDIGKRVKMEFFETETYYDIPASCAESKHLSNLYFAGKNISATEDAIASARVIGTCLQTGYAVGEMAGKLLKK